MMSCRQCAARLSERIDGTLDRASRARVDEHLARCPGCAAALRELEESLRLLREASPGEPPGGLAGGILLRLASARRPAAPSMRSPRSPRARAAAAAAILLGILAGLLAWQGHSVAGRVAELESEVSGMRGRWESERAALEGALDRARRDLQAARADAERAGGALGAEAAGRERLEALVARLEEDLGAESERAAALESDLAALREGRSRRAEGDGTAASFQRTDPDPVVLRRHGGRLELETRGPPHVFIPRLFELARDGSAPEVSSLALGSLEGILGIGEPAPARAADPEPDPRVGPAKWVRRGVSVFTSAAGLEDGPVEEAPPDETPRERRLRALETIWRRAAGAKG